MKLTLLRAYLSKCQSSQSWVHFTIRFLIAYKILIILASFCFRRTNQQRTSRYTHSFDVHLRMQPNTESWNQSDFHEGCNVQFVLFVSRIGTTNLGGGFPNALSQTLNYSSLTHSSLQLNTVLLRRWEFRVRLFLFTHWEVCHVWCALFMQGKIWLRIQLSASSVFSSLWLCQTVRCAHHVFVFQVQCQLHPSAPRSKCFCPLPPPLSSPSHVGLRVVTWARRFPNECCCYLIEKSYFWHLNPSFFLCVPQPQDFKHTQSFMLWEAGLPLRTHHPRDKVPTLDSLIYFLSGLWASSRSSNTC